MLKKNNLAKFCALAVAAGTLFGACQKDNADEVIDMTGRLGLTAEGMAANNSKMAVHDPGAPSVHQFKWASGDNIFIANVGASNPGFQTKEVTLSGSVASISANGIDQQQAIVAFSNTRLNPTFVSGTNYKVTLPNTYTYRADASGNQLLDVPMVAYLPANSAEGTLAFKALTAVVAVKVANSSSGPINLEKIELKNASAKLDGEISIDISQSTPTVFTDYQNNNGTTITMNFTTDHPLTIPAGSSKYVLIPIRPVNMTAEDAPTYFKVNITAENSAENIIPAKIVYNSPVPPSENHLRHRTINRAEVAYANTTITDEHNCGLFTVNESGKKVVFSSGNLKYNGSTFAIMPNQYDVLENGDNIVDWNDINEVVYVNGWRSLFVDPANLEAGLIDESYEVYQYQVSGSSDWPSTIHGFAGFNTLSSEEWQYLLSNHDHAVVVINGVSGLMVVPDNWEVTGHATGASAIDASNFAEAQQYGALFIPGAGCLSYDAWGYSTENNYYWTSDMYYIDPTAVPIDLQSIENDVMGTSAYGAAVRLVKTITAGN